MKQDKILLSICNLDDIKDYKKLGITNFLFPLKDFSVGYPSFSFDEIKNLDVNEFILMNRVLEDEDIDLFIDMKIPKNVKGFIVEDIGLLEDLKNKGYEVILYQNHLNNNYKTINHWLKSFDSLVISTDITKDEIEEIVSKSDKDLVLNTFGYPMIMYSRRTLVTNYLKHIDKPLKKDITINEERNNQKFFLIENDFGTVVFYKIPFDYRDLASTLDKKIKYYLINSSYIDKNTIYDVIKGNEVDANRGFLDTKTVYRIGDIK